MEWLRLAMLFCACSLVVLVAAQHQTPHRAKVLRQTVVLLEIGAVMAVAIWAMRR